MIAAKYGYNPMNQTNCLLMHFRIAFCRVVIYISSNRMILYVSIVGSVVEFSPATREARVQFPDDAIFFVDSCNYDIMLTSMCISLFYQMYD